MKNKKNILVLTYWSYKDALIQAYTLPYLNIISEHLPFGSKIYLITLEQENFKMSIDEKAQVQERLRLQGIRLISFRYREFNILNMIFWAFVSIYLLAIIQLKNIRAIHAWCTPAGSIGYILSIMTGRPLIVDSYEPHSEAMVENSTWKREGLRHRLLFYFEKKLSKHAKILISATQKMQEYALDTFGVKVKELFVKPACVDLQKFNLSRKKNKLLMRQFDFKDKIVCVYAGKFGGIYLTQEVFDFFKVAEDYWGDKFRVLLLTGHNKSELQQWAKNSGFDPMKMQIKYIFHSDIPDYIGLGDFAITPVKPIPTKRYCTPIKDGEYWALGLPVVIPEHISDDSEIISSLNIGATIKEFSTDSFKTAIEKIDSLIKSNQDNKLTESIFKTAEANRNFNIAKEIYGEIYGGPKSMIH